MKEEKALSGKKIALIITISAIVVFAIWNIAWLSFVHTVYKPYMDAVGCNERGEYTVVDSDNYRYSVFKPSYLSFTSNLSISENIALNEVSESYRCSLIIWPKLSGSYQFGLSLTVPNKLNKDSENISFQTYGFMLDENMNSIEKLNDSAITILEDNKETISLLYEKAHNMWGIGD